MNAQQTIHSETGYPGTPLLCTQILGNTSATSKLVLMKLLRMRHCWLCESSVRVELVLVELHVSVAFVSHNQPSLHSAVEVRSGCFHYHSALSEKTPWLVCIAFNCEQSTQQW